MFFYDVELTDLLAIRAVEFSNMFKLSFKHFQKPTAFSTIATVAMTLVFLVGISSTSTAGWIALTRHDGIPVAGKRHRSAHAALVKRPGVELTTKQAVFASKFGQYLKSRGESAVITSGARSPEHQLSIIKAKVRSIGATRRFPELRRATVSRTSSWLRAWDYLRARHVPVYAPNSAGGEALASNHTKGLAIDFISGSLDHLASLVRSFSYSHLAMLSPLRVASIAREPGCVHVNLAN